MCLDVLNKDVLNSASCIWFHKRLELCHHLHLLCLPRSYYSEWATELPSVFKARLDQPRMSTDPHGKCRCHVCTRPLCPDSLACCSAPGCPGPLRPLCWSVVLVAKKSIHHLGADFVAPPRSVSFGEILCKNFSGETPRDGNLCPYGPTCGLLKWF